MSTGLNSLHEPVWIYLVIPVGAAFVGYVTKLLMIEMMFRPLEFVGVLRPFLGWQGQVPRNAAKTAVRTVSSLRDQLLDPRELIDRIDVEEMLAELEGPLRTSVEEVTAEIAAEFYPTLWNSLPAIGKRAVTRRLHDRTPEIAHRLIAELRDNLDAVFDLEHTVVDTLVRDKRKLVLLFRRMGGDSFGFMTRAGLVFGFDIGIAQAIVLLITGEKLVVPLFGLLTGGLTDWLALQMIFRPARPGRFLGLTWQGRFHKLRPQITRDYAGVIATDILSPATVLDSALTGPQSDRFIHLLDREVQRAIDDQTPALAKPLVVVATGGERYQRMKERAATRMVQEIQHHTEHVSDYASRALDLQELIAERMERLDDKQYENLLRPIFRDQEWVVIVLGATLGFLLGELQVHLLLS